MAKPSRERVRKWRERKAKKGGRSLSTWLEPETVRMMDYLLGYYDETAAPLVARAISNLYAATRQDDKLKSAADWELRDSPADPVDSVVKGDHLTGAPAQADDSAPSQEPTAVEPVALEEMDLLLVEMQTKLAAGTPLKTLQKTLLVQWIKLMKTKKVSFEAMAEQLNAAGIPTLSGKGQWEQGMIPTVLLLSAL